MYKLWTVQIRPPSILKQHIAWIVALLYGPQFVAASSTKRAANGLYLHLIVAMSCVHDVFVIALFIEQFT